MKQRSLRACAGLAALAALAAVAAKAEGREWEDLSTNSINRLPARTYTMPLEKEKDALTSALEPQSPYTISLNGDWKYSWAGDPEARVKDFWRIDYDDSNWFDIDVPSCVEMRGFGSPGYVNVRYPHKNEWPYIKDRDTGESNYNPVSSYRKIFTVPVAWKGRKIVLRFDGVYSAYYVWLNGRKIGYAEDSALPSEFDVTKFINFDEGAACTNRLGNLVCVEAYRWSDGSYLEDQDMTRYSGIFRDVTLWSMPADGIWDFTVRTRFAPDYGSATLSVGGIDGGWTGTLYTASGVKVGTLSSAAPSLSVANVRMWSAEDPYLYTLVLRKGGDIRSRRVGFKDQRVAGNKVLVNGKAIKLKGVNRHETNPDNGRTVTLEDMIKDAELMKRANINTVRTSHYPDHHLWYDVCDRYGIYLVAEANVEGHEPGYGDKGLGRFPEWEHSIVERNVRHAVFYRNHPSVTFWSMGNETGHGDCFRKAMAEVRAVDPTRFVHYERGNPDADIDSVMYPAVDWVEKRGMAGDGLCDPPINEWEERHGFTNPQSKSKPFFICEYAHAMGNSVGNLQEYWDAIYAHESLLGGCIWDWADQAVWKYTDRVDPATGKRERYLSYGGDFDEEPNDGPFNCNGVVDALRRFSPKLAEVAHVYRNLVVRRAADGGWELENRFGFTDASAFNAEWELVADGRRAASGRVAVPSIAPLTRGRIEPEGLADAVAKEAGKGSELFVNFAFKLRNDAVWAKRGHAVARDQIALAEGGAAKFAEPIENSFPGKGVFQLYHAEGGPVKIEAGKTKAVIDQQSGTLRELVMDGVVILKDPAPGIAAGPQLTCAKAFTDNDILLRNGATWSDNPVKKLGFYSSGLSQLRHHVRPIEVIERGGTVKVVTEVTGRKSAGYVHEAIWRFCDDGTFTIENTVTPHGRFPAGVPRLGLSMKLSPALETMRWYGRGPWENYVDRNTASFLGVYDGAVSDQFTDYARPQDNGGKSDVRWVEFLNAEGRGVRFTASEPMFVQALHYGWEDLEFARHRNGQQRFRSPLVARPEICVNLDVRQYGLGGNSCGPVTLEKYRFDPTAPVSWTVKVEMVK